ncbi:MAG: dienelactone hydrolase family protein [Pseudomonadota bacterium]
MCDERTELDLVTRPAAGLSRRRFALTGAVAAIASACRPGTSADAGIQSGGAALAEQAVTFPTADGMADGFFVHPQRGAHPAILMWPDIAGLRAAYETMARRLAGAGYAVLVINQYYRSARSPVLESFAEWRTPEGKARLQPMISAITAVGTSRDAAACVGWLDRQPAVDSARGIGSSGYCMGGPFAVRTAAAAPLRVKAAASFHGAALVTERDDSPHRLLGQTQARYLFAIAQNDDARAPGDKDTLRAAAQAAGRPAEVEVYPAEHGWCTIDSPVHDPVQAERAWGRMLALFGAL